MPNRHVSEIHTSEITDLLHFLNASPTAWHAVENVADRLQKAGFQPLKEEAEWVIQPGGRYYVTRNGSSLCAFIVPKAAIQDVRLLASHTDSPSLKLKPNAEFTKENMLLLGVEVYGSPLLNSWLNRDLGIAGRVAIRDAQGQLKEVLVRLDAHPVVIPQLAIHLDRNVNENGLLLNKQEHLAALAAVDLPVDVIKEGYLAQLIKEQVPYQKLLGADLFLFPLEPAALVGYQKRLIASYRIDSLCSVHAITTAFVKPESQNAVDATLKMAVLWDNEEIGSGTAQGANSPFLMHVLERITLAQQISRADYLRLLNRSLCISIDLAHALHPNYMERHEPRHPILLNRGVALKNNAQQRYATDARSAAQLIDLCDRHQIPLQKMVTRGDIPCGTTIGPIHAQLTGMLTVDIGTPQLSMHACRELASCRDHLYLCQLLTEILK